MENRKQFAAKFSGLLNRSLFYRYKKIPSANFFANQFNLRAKGTTTITPETARKWMKGIVVPEVDRFIVLIDWLEMHPSELFTFNANFNKSSEPQDKVLMSHQIKKLETQILNIRIAVDEFEEITKNIKFPPR